MHDEASMLAIRHLRAHRGATLLVDGLPTTLRTAIDGEHGRLLAPVPAFALEGEDIVLAIPEETPDVGATLSAQVEIEGIDPDRVAACDRWTAAHGAAPFATWIAMTIESARFAGTVLDGAELDLRNPLRAEEARLLRTINADRTALIALVRGACGIGAADPVAVSIDPDGIDVRSSSAVLPLRIPIDPAIESHADERVRGLLAGGRA
jgi:hypothetical protein